MFIDERTLQHQASAVSLHPSAIVCLIGMFPVFVRQQPINLYFGYRIEWIKVKKNVMTLRRIYKKRSAI